MCILYLIVDIIYCLYIYADSVHMYNYVYVYVYCNLVDMIVDYSIYCMA